MAGEQGRHTSLWQQTFALLWKILLVTWRRKWHTLLEWTYHLLWVLLVIAVTFIHRNSRIEELTTAEDLGRLDEFEKKGFIVGYVPSTAGDQEIMQKVNESVQSLGLTVKEFLDEEQMLQNTTGKTVVGVMFDNKFKYSIRYKMNDVPNPSEYIGTCEDNHMNCSSSLYWRNGFLLLQASIDAAIVEVTTNRSVRDSMISAVAVEMRSVLVTRKLLKMASIILAMCLSYASLFYMLMRTITKERKELREIMRMMGLRDSAYWLSWGLLYLLYVVIFANLITLLISKSLFLESSYGVILLLFLFYGISMISFTFMLCSLFRAPMYTSDFIITLLLCILSLLPLVKVLPKTLETLLCIFPPFAFSLGITESIHMENEFQGVFFSDITVDAWHVLTSYISLLLDSAFYLLLTLYFDKILADNHGLKLEPLFFLRPYWSKRKMNSIPLDTIGREEAGAEDYVEQVPVELLGKEAIRLNKVKKIYGDKDKMTEALRDLDLDVYEGQITALLGHSGAGKTTLLNILSGMSKASGGEIYGSVSSV